MHTILLKLFFLVAGIGTSTALPVTGDFSRSASLTVELAPGEVKQVTEEEKLALIDVCDLNDTELMLF